MTVEFPEEPGLKRVAGFVVAVGSFSPERAREIGLKTLETAERISRELGPLLRTVNLHFPLSRPLLT